MRRLLFSAILFVTTSALANGPTINYQGRITAAGGNYSGQGYFKFVLLNGNDEGLWANNGNDGTNEPPGSISVGVNNGLFSVELGDFSMNAIPPLAFHQWQVHLRTWFSTNASTFEQLSPDTQIRPIDFSQIDTREAVLVHHSGNADFNDIQAAIDCVETNDNVNTILVLPGYYQVAAPLTCMPGNWITIRGLGASEGDVTIENTNGPALAMLNGKLDNMKFLGAPALFHNGSDEDELNLARCAVEPTENAFGPVAVIQGYGEVNVFETSFGARGDGAIGLVLLESARFGATHSAFECWDTANAIAVACSNWSGEARFESCDLEGGDQGASLGIIGGQGRLELTLCDLNNGIMVTNAMLEATFSECEIRGMAPLRVVNGGQRNILFRNCRMSTQSNATVYVQDVVGGVNFQNCTVECRDGTAVHVVGTDALEADQTVDVNFDYSEISNWSDGSVTNADTIVIVDTATNEDAGAGVELMNCSVHGNIRDGINSTGGEVCVLRSSVEANRNGILAVGAEVEIDFSHLECDGGDCVNLSGPCHLEMFKSDICGDGPGRAVYVSSTETTMPIVIQDSTMESPGGPAMECHGGRFILGGNMFLSGLGTPVLIRETNNIVTLDKCRLLSHADLFGATNTNPALVLYGASSVVTPRLTGCLLEPASTAPYSIGLQGGATTGNVYMINSCISTGLSPNVGLLNPGTQLNYGNYVVPAGP